MYIENDLKTSLNFLISFSRHLGKYICKGNVDLGIVKFISVY